MLLALQMDEDIYFVFRNIFYFVNMREGSLERCTVTHCTMHNCTRTTGGRISTPLRFFADSEKTAVRSAAKFAIAVQPTI